MILSVPSSASGSSLPRIRPCRGACHRLLVRHHRVHQSGVARLFPTGGHEGVFALLERLQPRLRIRPELLGCLRLLPRASRPDAPGSEDRPAPGGTNRPEAASRGAQRRARDMCQPQGTGQGQLARGSAYIRPDWRGCRSLCQPRARCWLREYPESCASHTNGTGGPCSAAWPLLLGYLQAMHIPCQPGATAPGARNLWRSKAIRAAGTRRQGTTCPCPEVGTMPIAGYAAA